jgi:hypothetical protein
MRKNYIAPSTETATWASMNLMQAPQIGIATGSGGTTPSTDQGSFID